MNRHKPRWKCPVCNQNGVTQEKLCVDLYFLDILNATESQWNEDKDQKISFDKDGEWKVVEAGERKVRERKRTVESPGHNVTAEVVFEKIAKFGPEAFGSIQVWPQTIPFSSSQEIIMILLLWEARIVLFQPTT